MKIQLVFLFEKCWITKIFTQALYLHTSCKFLGIMLTQYEKSQTENCLRISKFFLKLSYGSLLERAGDGPSSIELVLEPSVSVDGFFQQNS